MSRPACVLDTETFVNYYSIQCREVHGQQRTRVFERLVDQQLDIEGVCRILRNYTIITFNGRNYDCPVLALALSGATNRQLKQLSDDIIQGGLKFWEVRDRYGVELPSYVDHIDVMEVSPGSPNHPSLKLYAGRMHSRRMQDLPLDPSLSLTPEQMDTLRSYGINDLDVTRDLYLELLPQITLRTKMSERYGVDLRSKSDAQVAEAVIKAEIFKRTGRKVYKPENTAGKFFYKAPEYIRFDLPQLQALRETFESSAFVVDRAGVLHAPTVLEKGVVFAIDLMKYKAGYGGLHSMEKSVWWKSDDDYEIVDTDATSYYAALILGSGIFPKHLGPIFLDIYREIYRERVAAKRAGDKDTAESLKITILGIIGKFGSTFSAVFSPDLLMQVTLTGQLAVLMLIERFAAAFMRVLSANTDGVVTRVPRARRDEFNRIVAQWEIDTIFQTEEVTYRAIYSRDVNSYFAIKVKADKDGNVVKRKGMFTEAGRGLPGAAGMKKTPDREICIEAVIAYLKDGIPVERTIYGCTDVRKFLSVRRVQGGAERDGEYIGKAVRWYWGIGETGHLAYATNGNKVPKSEGAVPCMELPDELPLDVDHGWYIREAYAILEEVGVEVLDPSFVGRTGETIAHLDGQSTSHIVKMPTGVARCGRTSKSLRVRWIEGVSGRMCKKCQESP